MSVGCASGFIDDMKFIWEVSLKLLDKTNGMKMNGMILNNVWADEGWEEPIIEERFDPDRTVLSLSFVKKEYAKMKEDSNFIQKNERSLKEVLNHKDYEKILPIIEYLETNS